MKLSYLSYFFTYETHIPDGIGFALFGPWHLLWLSVIFAICVRYVWIYKKGDERKKRRMDGLTALFPCGVDCRESNLYCRDP